MGFRLLVRRGVFSGFLGCNARLCDASDIHYLVLVALPGNTRKILLKLQIVDAKTMATLTLRQAVVRYLGYFLSILVILMGFFWIAFDQRKQAWHDKLAGSVVIVKPQ